MVEGRQPFADVRSPGDALASVVIEALLESIQEQT
jgi:hypothetical protein